MSAKVPPMPFMRERGGLARSERTLADGIPPEGTKRCMRCQRVKLFDRFHVRPDRPCGYHSWCKTCRRIYASEKRKTDAARERDRLYRQRPDQRAKKAEYNRTQLAEYRKAYWQTPKGRLVNRRNAARHRARYAATDGQRDRALRLVAAYDAELARMEARAE